MAKRKNRSKRSLGSLPKGLPHKKAAANSANPFEFAGRQKGPKHQVHNRHISNLKQHHVSKGSVLKRRSQELLQDTLNRAKKANIFVDRRIGEYNRNMSTEEQNLARLVKERTRRSKKITKYNLNDDDYNDKGMLLTHRGKVIDDELAAKSVILSDDEDDGGNLDAMDTALNFGGMGAGDSAYGPSAGGSGANMSENYTQRKKELDDMILRRKVMKAERIKAREQQEEVIADLDGAFKELSGLLQFRDKEMDIRQHIKDKREGNLDNDAQEIEDWHQEIREYHFMGKRGKATDRTKTPEELAKEEAEKLHGLETRRLARMNGDFENDDFSDLSDEEDSRSKKKKRKKEKKKSKNPDEINESDGDDDDDGEELKAKFTADGLVYVNKKGEIVKRFGEHEEEQDDDDESAEDSDSDSEKVAGSINKDTVLKVGTKVKGNYRAAEQYQEKEHWYDGTISKVNVSEYGAITYNVDYADGDFEEDMEPKNVRVIQKSKEETAAEEEKMEEAMILKRKRGKARDKARKEIPFVFEVPTTLEALHSMIAKYATTGNDASLVIQRIHASNSVKLDRRNAEKMQNFYDVLLRRFVAVGDAIHASGDGGPELGRYQQLDAITKVLYQMTQDSPDCASAVWGRRFGILHSAHAKRLRDAEFERDGEDGGETSAWPSVGVVLLLRVAGHLFPATDRRHSTMTPVILFLGQMLSQTPVESIYDLVMGNVCAGLLIEYTKEARRFAPEAVCFLAGVIRLFACDSDERTMPKYPVPTLEAAACRSELSGVRSLVAKHVCDGETLPPLSFEDSHIRDRNKAATSVLSASLHLSGAYATSMSGSMGMAEKETFSVVTNSLLLLKPKSKSAPMPKLLVAMIASTALKLAESCKLDQDRKPLTRRLKPPISETALKSLAPRLEDPERYSKSKDKGKNALQVAADRTRREYKREHKAVARELRLDAAFVEEQRRKEEESKTTRARAERNKNFAWLEGEQAAMNQQVRQGGGLLKGGGMGAAKSKAKSAKLGIKKGGKF